MTFGFSKIFVIICFLLHVTRKYGVFYQWNFALLLLVSLILTSEVNKNE